MSETLKYSLSGAAAGAANGLFGAGGGMVLVPLMTRWAGLEDKKAFATAISIIAPMCLVSVVVYCLRGNLEVMTALPYLIGGFFGGLAGGKLFRSVPAGFLHKALGILILYGGIRQFL